MQLRIAWQYRRYIKSKQKAAAAASSSRYLESMVPLHVNECDMRSTLRCSSQATLSVVRIVPASPNRPAGTVCLLLQHMSRLAFTCTVKPPRQASNEELRFYAPVPLKLSQHKVF